MKAKKIIFIALAVLFQIALSSVAFAQTSARSGFIDGFDKSKYKEMTLKEFCDECFKSDSDVFAEVECHFQRIDREYTESGIKEFHCYGDGISDVFASKLIPSNIPPFTAIELYIRHASVNAGSWYSVDGWEVWDYARFPGQKYIATDALKIREAPSLSAKQIGRLVKDERATVIEVGEDVTIDGIESAWVKVRTKDGAEGWCFAGYLTDGKEYREPLWKSVEKIKIGAYEKRQFVQTLCAYDWYMPGVDDSIVYRFYTKDGNLYLNEYCYDVHADVSLKLEYKGLPVEIVEREGKLLCECDEVRLSAYLGKEVALYDGKLRGTLYDSYDDEPYLYAFDLYEHGKGDE